MFLLNTRMCLVMHLVCGRPYVLQACLFAQETQRETGRKEILRYLASAPRLFVWLQAPQTVSARAAWRNITRCHLGNKSSRWDSARTSARQDAAAQPLTVPVLTPAVDTKDQSCSGNIRKRRKTHLPVHFLLLCCSLKVCAAWFCSPLAPRLDHSDLNLKSTPSICD